MSRTATADDRAGMAWWNGMTDTGRADWLARETKIRGRPATPAECWRKHCALKLVERGIHGDSH